jgi:hypothetical protein
MTTSGSLRSGTSKASPNSTAMVREMKLLDPATIRGIRAVMDDRLRFMSWLSRTRSRPMPADHLRWSDWRSALFW